MQLEPGGLLVWIIVGLVAGFLASHFVRGGGYGLIGDLVIGLIGAVIGGFLVGVFENLAGTYISFIGTSLKLTVALALIIVVLLVRPSGLLGRAVVHRV